MNQLHWTLGNWPYYQNLADLMGHVGAEKLHFSLLYILDNDWNDDFHGQFKDQRIVDLLECAAAPWEPLIFAQAKRNVTIILATPED
jgi:hypothetical protein